ncbi:MAG TPA: hypothetical protein VFH45_09940 [Acidimicrobiales bacterium]|nr:hypothetical protein [Acidimicrobiales bacterium]
MTGRPAIDEAVGRAELERRRDDLLAALRDIEEEHRAGDIGTDDYRVLRDDYTARAAEVIRRLDEGEEAPGVDAAAGSVASPVATRRRRRRFLRRGLILAGLVLCGLGAGLVAVGATGSRQPGRPATGSLPLTPSDELQAAQRAMAAGDDAAAVRLYDAVLESDPRQPQALAYRGWLVRLAGDAQKRQDMIQRGVADERAAVAADPAYPDAHFFLGVILLDDLHQPAAAVPELQAYLATNPPAAVRSSVQPILQRAQQEAAAG